MKSADTNISWHEVQELNSNIKHNTNKQQLENQKVLAYTILSK